MTVANEQNTQETPEFLNVFKRLKKTETRVGSKPAQVNASDNVALTGLKKLDELKDEKYAYNYSNKIYLETRRAKI